MGGVGAAALDSTRREHYSYYTVQYIYTVLIQRESRARRHTWHSSRVSRRDPMRYAIGENEFGCGKWRVPISRRHKKIQHNYC